MENNLDLSQISVGDALTNNQIREVFKCGPQGGMRKSNTTNTLVLVSDQTQKQDRNPYQDKWIDGVLHYTGMGLKGNQSLSFMQNKTLANLDKTKTKAYLFEKLSKKLYTFRGEVTLVGEIYFEEQEDNEGNIRKVIKFPLKIVYINKKFEKTNNEQEKRSI